MDMFPKMTRAEGAAYYHFADAMRRLEWDIHYYHSRGLGLPAEWHRIAMEPGPGPRDKITIAVDRKVLQFFKGMGRGYQGRMNEVLRAFVSARLAKIIKGPEDFSLRASAEDLRLPGGPKPAFGDTEAEETRAVAEWDALQAEVARMR